MDNIDKKCLNCNQNTIYPFNINNLYYCTNCVYRIKSILESKYTTLLGSRTYGIYERCNICGKFIKSPSYIITFHHCFIPIKNKYMNVNVL